MKRSNLFKTIGASLATAALSPVARFLPLAPVAVAEIEDLSQTPLSQCWLSWSHEPFNMNMPASAFTGTFRLDLASVARLKELQNSGVQSLRVENDSHAVTGAFNSISAYAEDGWSYFARKPVFH